MGGLCSTGTDSVPTSTTVIQGTQIPEWVSQGGQKLFNEASELAKQPYPAYTGARVAPFTADENTGFQLSRDSVGAWQPYMDSANSQLAAAGETWSPAAAQRYMDPYAINVSDIVARKAKEAYDVEKMGQNARAVQAGAFGGARHGVNDVLGQEKYLQTVGDIYTTGLSNAYDRAGQLFQADRGRDMEIAKGYGQLGQLGQQMTGTDIANVMATGGQQRQLGQLSLDTAYQDYLNQRQWPYQQVNFALGALSGTPYDKTSTQSSSGQQIVQSPSVAGQLAGTGLTAAALWKLFGS